MITVSRLVKNYTNAQNIETKVLRGVDLEVSEGEFVSIIGPSGAGKSTLLYQMSLLDRPTSGSIQIAGKEVAELNEQEATQFRLEHFGFVFQDYALLPELTAEENIAMPSLMVGASVRDAIASARKVLESLDALHVADHLPSQLSGGEQQRVSIARAIARKPKILFADEPTANLDSQRSQEVIEAFLELNKRGQTIVMVTHEMEYAERAHRIIELRDGQIVKDRALRHR